MEMEWSYVGAVVISGLIIVFVALILLILAVWLMGQIFTAIKAGKSKKAEAKDAPANAAAPVKASPGAAPAPAAIAAAAEDDEVIAVIAAAVAAMAEESGKALRIKSIRPAKGKARTNAWAGAAAAESTRAF